MARAKIRWNAKQVRALENAVEKYNKIVVDMEQSGVYDITPNRTNMVREVNLIETRQELKQRIDELSRITEDSAFNVVDMNGASVPQYLKDEIGSAVDSINGRRESQRDSILSDDMSTVQQYTKISNKNLAYLNKDNYVDGDDLDELWEAAYPRTYHYADQYKTEWENYNGDPMVADIIDYMAENYPDELALIFESGDDEVEINYIYPQDKSSDKTPEDIRHKNIKNYWNEVYHQYHGGNHPDYKG